MGVVHHHGHLVIGAVVGLHPPGDGGSGQSGGHRLLRHPQHLRRRHGGQGVLHVEFPGHGEGELPGVPGGADGEAGGLPLPAQVPDEHVGPGGEQGEGDAAGAGLRRGQDPLGVVAVQVDHRRPGLGENAQLRGEVVLKIRVLHRADVVLPDVEEHRARQVHPVHPVVLQGLAGDLHGHITAPGPRRVEQVPLEVQGLGGGELGGAALHAVVGDDGGEKGGLVEPPGGLPVVQDAPEEVGRGGLALGAGDAGDGQLSRGVAPGKVGQQGHGGADVGDLDAGGTGAGVGPLADIGSRPLPKGLQQVFLLEGRPLAQEEGAGDHHLGIAGDHGHRPRQVGGQREGACEQAVFLQELAVRAQGMAGAVHGGHLSFVTVHGVCPMIARRGRERGRKAALSNKILEKREKRKGAGLPGGLAGF